MKTKEELQSVVVRSRELIIQAAKLGDIHTMTLAAGFGVVAGWALGNVPDEHKGGKVERFLNGESGWYDED